MSRFLSLLTFFTGALMSACASGLDEDGAEIDSIDQSLCSGTALQTSPAAPSNPGTTVNLDAGTATCAPGETPEYRFFYQREGTSSYTPIRDWGAARNTTWNTTGLPSGKYQLLAHARAVGAAAVTSSRTTFLLNDVCTTSLLSAAPGSPQTPGAAVNLQATASCSGAATPEFRFGYRREDVAAVTELRTWGSGSATWDTTNLTPGIYDLIVYGRAAGNTSLWETAAHRRFILGDACTGVSVVASPRAPQPPTATVNLAASASCTAGAPEFRFFYQAPGLTTWTPIRDWGSAAVDWTLPASVTGTYMVRADVRTVGSTGTQQSIGYARYTVEHGCLPDSCGANAGCANVPGGFACYCYFGYAGDGQVCRDVDECATNPNPCGVNASCTNTVGSYSCACNPGFFNNGGICSDINECFDMPCGAGTCTNTVGSYNCSCSAPLLVCDEQCVDPGTNRSHCGACGNACGAEQQCAAGRCVTTLWTAVSAGVWRTCGLRPDGTAACWGEHPDTSPTGESLVSVAAGRDFACGLRANGLPLCWGDASVVSTTPNEPLTLLEAGYDHMCGLKPSGQVVCWGDNYYGQSSAPAGEFIAISAGAWHSCGLLRDGTARCWGHNSSGERTPPPGESFTAIAAGIIHTCALRANGSVRCWGFNGNGETAAPAGEGFTAISTSSGHTCALASNGRVVCWGQNENGQLDAPSEPFVAVSTGARHTCALRASGTIACWGTNGDGQGDPPPP